MKWVQHAYDTIFKFNEGGLSLNWHDLWHANFFYMLEVMVAKPHQIIFDL